MPKTRSKASTADGEIPAKKMAQEKDLAHDTGIVVELLNDATMAHGPEKIELLRKIQERIVFKVRFQYQDISSKLKIQFLFIFRIPNYSTISLKK